MTRMYGWVFLLQLLVCKGAMLSRILFEANFVETRGNSAYGVRSRWGRRSRQSAVHACVRHGALEVGGMQRATVEFLMF